jgi:hypothetical protein
MTWHKLIPANTGGGRKRSLLTARLTAEGQLSMSHAVADMLGTPDRVTVEVDPDAQCIRLTPTTPDNAGGFALSGGGNASYRVRMTEAIKRWPDAGLVGEYKPKRQAASVVFEKAK